MYFKLRKTHFKRSPFWIGHSNQIESKSEFIFKLCQQIDAKAGAAFVTVRDLVGETHILLLLFAQQRTSRKYNFFCLSSWSLILILILILISIYLSIYISRYLPISVSLSIPPSPSLFPDKKFPALGLIPCFRSKFGDWTFMVAL